MQYMILGAGSGMPHPDFHSSSLYVKTADACLLFDCGEGVSRQLMRHNLNLDVIDALIVSHYHPDHISGLFMLLQMYYLEIRTKPLYLFLPERPAAIIETMHLFYTFEQRFPFPLMVHDVNELELFYPHVSPLMNDHLLNYEEFLQNQSYPNTLLSYSFLIEEDNKSLIYTSDINTFANIEKALQRADVIIIDALHPKPEEIVSLLNHHTGKIILTHGISKSLSEWLTANPGNRIETARESRMFSL